MSDWNKQLKIQTKIYCSPRENFHQIQIIFQCVPILGRGFETGGYKCECRQGFEYPFEDPITYFDGQLMEAEFVNMVKDKETK